MGRAGTKVQRLKRTAHVAPSGASGLSSYDQIVEQYKQDTPTAHRKLYGQFFTPQPIADLMCDWVLAGKPDTVLDPAIGPGVFAATILERSPGTRVVGVDIDPEVLKYTRMLHRGRRLELIQDDFLTTRQLENYSAIIANPPYLRHHDFSYDIDIFEAIGERNDVKLSKLSNIYVLFVLEICRRLVPTGRAAIIIPTEWANANFGKAMKDFLLERGLLKRLLYFTHEALPFEDALTTASVLLLEKQRGFVGDSSVSTHFLTGVTGAVELRQLASDSIEEVEGVISRIFPASVLRAEKKWDHLLKTGSQDRVRGLVPLRSLAKTKRGIATGANEFFHVPLQRAKEFGIQGKHLLPCVGGASAVKGFVFCAEDFEQLVRSGRRSHLISIGSPSAMEEKYLAEGVAAKLPSRYLLAARKEWHVMERRDPAPIWAAVFGREGVRFIRNKANVLNLTTFHCIYPLSEDSQFIDALTVCLNSKTVQERARKQQRVYGGGLLKFEPKDLLDIEVPDLSKVSRRTIERLAATLPSCGADSTNMLPSQIDSLVEDAIREAAL